MLKRVMSIQAWRLFSVYSNPFRNCTYKHSSQPCYVYSPLFMLLGNNVLPLLLFSPVGEDPDKRCKVNFIWPKSIY